MDLLEAFDFFDGTGDFRIVRRTYRDSFRQPGIGLDSAALVKQLESLGVDSYFTEVGNAGRAMIVSAWDQKVPPRRMTIRLLRHSLRVAVKDGLS